MAAPHVTGAAALYASSHPGASAEEIRAALLASVLPTASLAGKTTTGGRLDLSTVINAPPPPPISLAAACVGPARVSGEMTVALSWLVTSNATSYRVRRASTMAGPLSLVADNLASAAFEETVVADGSTYEYAVTALNSSGESLLSTAVEITPVPPVPSDISASSPRLGELLVTWTDQSSDEQGFMVEYYTGLSWVRLGNAAAGETSVMVGGVKSGAAHRFRVNAFNQTAQTPYSAIGKIELP